jgi:GNAT superfamily N-acetyltransferase
VVDGWLASMQMGARRNAPSARFQPSAGEPIVSPTKARAFISGEECMRLTLQVERATEADIPAWLGLAEEVGDLFGADMANDLGFHERLKRNVARGTAFCVRIDNELSGAMLFRGGWIHWLAVLKRFRRLGVGRALIAHTLSAGESEVRVMTFGPGHPHPDSHAARAFYCTMGFKLSNEAPEPASDGTPREILVWRAS